MKSENTPVPVLQGEIRAFLQYLKKERNYSGHTIIAYEGDLDHFARFLHALDAQKKWMPNAIDQKVIRQFLGALLSWSASR